MSQDWFDSLPKEEEQGQFDSLPQEDPGSISPAPRPKLLSGRGMKTYGGQVLKGIGRLATGLADLGPAMARTAMDVEQNLQNRGLNPLTTKGFDVVKAVSEEAAEPMARGYVEGWKDMLSDPGKFIMENPDAFVGNILDVLTVGSAGAVRLARARKMLAGKNLSGATVKSVLKSATAGEKNAEVAKVIGGIPEDARIAFPGEGPGAVYGEGGAVIGKADIPYNKPTVAPAKYKMGPVSPIPDMAEMSAPSWFDDLPTERPASPYKKVDIVRPTGEARPERVVALPDEIGPEDILGISKAEALRQASMPTTKMAYTMGGDLREVLADLSAPAAKAFDAAKMAFHSPDVVLGRHPAGKVIYDTLNANDLAKDKFLVREAKKLEQVAGDIKEGSSYSQAVFKARDNNLTIPDVVRMGDKAADYGFTKDEIIELRRYPEMAKQAESLRSFLSDNFDFLLRQFGASKISAESEKKIWNMANSTRGKAVNEKLLAGLTATEKEVFTVYSRKIKDYIPHIFDKQEMVDFIGGQLQKATDRLAKLKDTRMAGLAKKQVEELTIAMEKAQRGPQNILYDDLPKSIRFKFFEKRTGAKGYQVDSIKAYRTYLTGIAKKIFDEPTVRASLEQYAQLPPDMQAYAKWYLRDYLGYNRGPFDDMANGVKSLMWMKALGFNPRSAIVNWTQKINTFSDSSPADSAKGYAMGFTKEGKQLFEESGLMSEVPQHLWEGTPLEHRQAMDNIRNIAGYLFHKVEAGNKKHGFLTGYYESMRKGADKAKAMAAGIAKADKTQFRYGRVNMPKALRGPTGLVFQFWSYPIKQLEFLGKLWKENPAKFFAWVALSEGANKSTQEFLGTDLSTALGLGVNWGQLFHLVDNVAHGADAKQILYQLRKVPTGGGIFPYGLGPAMQSGKQVGELVNSLLAGADIDTGDALRPVLPVFIGRTAQAIDAIKSGKDTQGKYTIKSTITGRPTYKEGITDIAKRTFVGRPMVETEAALATKLRAFEQKSYNDLVTEISDLYAEGKTREAFELMRKYKIKPTKESLKAAVMRKKLTSTERAGKKKPSKARYQYEQHLKEGR